MNYLSKKGISLIESILYIAFLGVISVTIANILIHIGGVYQKARAEREVLSNARLLIETVTKIVSTSMEVYGPTSRFNIDVGQLSLITSVSPQPEHMTKYIDIWLDAGFLFIKEEGRGAVTLSASSVRVDRFRVERIYQGLGREAVRVTLGVSYANSKFAASTILTSTTALRGNY